MSTEELESIVLKVSDIICKQKVEAKKKALEESLLLKNLKKCNQKLNTYSNYEFSSSHSNLNIKNHFKFLIKIIEKQESDILELKNQVNNLFLLLENKSSN